MSGRLDRREIPARSLDVKHVDGVAEHRRRLRLHARVAATVQHEGRIGSEEPRAIRAQREGLAHALISFGDHARGVGVVPAALHEPLFYYFRSVKVWPGIS